MVVVETMEITRTSNAIRKLVIRLRDVCLHLMLHCASECVKRCVEV